MSEATVAGFAEPLRDGREVPLSSVQSYWTDHLHDAEISLQPIGTRQFFKDLRVYRDQKQSYLSRLIDFGAYRGKSILEVGCGLGFDLVRFAASGARVTGIDISARAIQLAKRNLAYCRTSADLLVMNGERMLFGTDSFDVVYSYSVLHFTPNPEEMVAEIHRVLRPGGRAILMVYNRLSWLELMARLTGVKLEHSSAPVFRQYSPREFRGLLEPFGAARIATERFPVKTRLHHGIKAGLFNRLFVPIFDLIPRRLVQSYGCHLIAFAKK